MGGDLGGDGKWVHASRRNWKEPDNKLLEILFMFTENFVHVYWNLFYWKFCSCLLEILFMFTEKKNVLYVIGGASPIAVLGAVLSDASGASVLGDVIDGASPVSVWKNKPDSTRAATVLEDVIDDASG